MNKTCTLVYVAVRSAPINPKKLQSIPSGRLVRRFVSSSSMMKKMIIARTLKASNPEISGFLGVTSVDPTNHLVGLPDCVPLRWDAVTPRPCGPETKLKQEYALDEISWSSQASH
jgi:hypothetical protein